jgi:folate-binding protein YgfZ
VSAPRVLSPEATYAAFGDGVAGLVTPCDVVRVTGRDALSYLQTQVSQDLAGLDPGDATESLVLSPKGRVDAYVQIARLDGEEIVVVVAAGFGEQLLERLGRFRLRVRAELELARWHRVVLRGPAAEAAASAAGLSIETGGTMHLARALDGAGLPTVAAAVQVQWPGLGGIDLLGPGAELPADVPVGDAGAFEAARIESGEPVMGREITERTVPQEAGIVERAVSFTKGCYPGQELVARIDARGDHVPRRLRGIELQPSASEPLGSPPAVLGSAGDALVVGAKTVGALTSVAWSPARGATVGLGYVQRDVAVPGDVELDSGGTRLVARLVELPFPRH